MRRSKIQTVELALGRVSRLLCGCWRILVQQVMARIGPRLGIAHPLETDAQRLVDGITDPALRSGAFYTSAANALAGPVVDHADI